MRQKVILSLAVVLTVAACGPATREAPETGSSGQAAAACSFPQWVGKPIDETAVRRLGRPYRIVPPDAAVTMDHVPERINLHTDAKGIVTKVRCG